MLSLLHIENIAVIESVDIQFGAGFNALTGETGAGKSIVVDAIGAIIGDRTSRDLIRTGAKKALVTGVFCNLPPLSWFEETGISPDENGELIVQRELQSDGRNICRVSGHLITVAQLKALGQQLLNIHGQHDGQQLLDPMCHLTYLDRFGQTEAALTDYTGRFQKLSELRREISVLHMDEAEKNRRMDSLRFQINDLERASLKPGEEEQLTARRNILRNAGKLMDAVEGAYQALSGDDESEGAASLLAMAEYMLQSAAAVSGDIGTLSEKAAELRYAADDLSELVRDLRASFDVSPEELDELEGRLDVIYRLRKKYGNSVEEMLDYLERCKSELDAIAFADDTLARLEKELNRAVDEAKAAAQTLSSIRRAAARTLEQRIQQELKQLDMPKVQFNVEFSVKDCELGLDATGMDEVQFLMSANAGETLKPIHKIASGGELARIMLALKNVLAENDDVSTLVFDEVDTGVSGRAAQKVAEKMAQVSYGKQVLCVTHLPQIAAMADTHFSVEKAERGGRTFTEVEELDVKRRCAELARLTGGTKVTSAMLKSAEELLSEAEQFKLHSRKAK